MDDVQVHYNSARPAQLNALAYAQGSEIHLAPGQEKHLPHEAWHVVQQMQGRVRPTLQLKGGGCINDDRRLEQEADRCANEVTQLRVDNVDTSMMLELKQPNPGNLSPIQRRVGMEYETNIGVKTEDGNSIGYHVKLFESKSKLWKIEADSSCVEFVTEPFDISIQGKQQLLDSVAELSAWASKVENVTIPVNGTTTPAYLEAVAPSMGTAIDVGGKKVEFPDKSITTAKILASPQATGGVPIEKIPVLFMSALGTVFSHLKNSTNGYNYTWKMNKPGEPPTREDVISILKKRNLEVEQEFKVMMGSEYEEPTGASYEPSELEIQSELKDEMESYQTDIDIYKSFTDQFSGTDINIENAPYTLMGMNSIDQKPLEMAVKLAGGAISKVKTTESVDLKKLQGLLTLVLSYIFVGAQKDKPYKYSKQIAPIMSRTNIKKLYDELSVEEKVLFTPDLVSSAISVDPDTALFASGYGNVIPEEGPTIADWIMSIREGTPAFQFPLQGGTATETLPIPHSVVANVVGGTQKPNFDADLLSRDSRSSVVKNYNSTVMIEGNPMPLHTTGGSSSMGEQNALDVDKVTGERLAVLELRRLPREQHILDWLPTAAVVYDAVKAINELE